MLSRLNYYWRVVATGVSFASFGLGGLFLSLFVFPILALIYRNPKRRQVISRKWVKKSFALFLWWMRFLGVIDYSFEGLEKLKEDRGCIVMGNHPSLIDVVVLIALCENPNGIVKKELFSNFFMKGVLTSAGFVPGAGGVDALKLCKTPVEHGDNFIIFPEGTRTVPGQPLRLRNGASQLALRLNSPIRLVHIKVRPTTLTKGEKWYHVPHKKVLFSLRVGDRVEVSKFQKEDLPQSIQARRLTQFLTQSLSMT